MGIILPAPKIEVKRLPKGASQSLKKTFSKNSHSPSKSGKLYPSGAFSIGFVPRKTARAEDLTYQRECDTWDVVETTIYDCRGGRKSRQWVKARDTARFIDTHYLGKTRTSRGSGGLTNHGKRYVRESCYLLEKKYGVKRLGFYTLTIPTCSVDTAFEIAYNWGGIYKYFFKLLRNYMYEKGHKEFYYVGVTENQSERSQRDSVPYYHLHWVMPCYQSGTTKWLVQSDTLRLLWKRALCNFCPELEGASFGASLDSSVLRKSASGYLSKYFSKGSDLREIHSILIPSSWYYSSREMKAWYKSSLVSLSDAKCEDILSVLTASAFVLFWNFVTTPDNTGSRDVIRGYYGAVKRTFYDYLTQS